MSEFRRALLILAVMIAGAAGAEGQSDPTRPPDSVIGQNVGGAQLSEPRLTSIVTRGNERIAVVDGRTLRVGDRIGTNRVVAIEASAVHVADSNGEKRSVWALYRTPAVKQPTGRENAR